MYKQKIWFEKPNVVGVCNHSTLALMRGSGDDALTISLTVSFGCPAEEDPITTLPIGGGGLGGMPGAPSDECRDDVDYQRMLAYLGQ